MFPTELTKRILGVLLLHYCLVATTLGSERRKLQVKEKKIMGVYSEEQNDSSLRFLLHQNRNKTTLQFSSGNGNRKASFLYILQKVPQGSY